MKTKVEIIESESGWGQKVDEVRTFPTERKASNFVKKFNKKNEDDYAKTHTVPSWYMYARIVT